MRCGVLVSRWGGVVVVAPKRWKGLLSLWLRVHLDISLYSVRRLDRRLSVLCRLAEDRWPAGFLLEMSPSRGIYNLGCSFVQADRGLEVPAERVRLGVFPFFRSRFCLQEGYVCGGAA
jgi:hypothetical protein